MSENIKHLKAVELFCDLPDDLLQEMNQHLYHRTVPRHMIILAAEQITTSVLILLQGTVKICVNRHGREAIINLIGPGEVLGEMSVLDGLGHSADVIALEETKLLWINRDIFNGYLRAVPQLSYNLARILARRLRLSTSRIESLSTLDIPGRIAHQLLAFGREYGQTAENGDIFIPLCLTQGDLAEFVGATRTRVNQALGQFKRNNIISISKSQHFTIHNVSALHQRRAIA